MGLRLQSTECPEELAKSQRAGRIQAFHSMAVRLPVATVFVFKTGFYIAQPGLESMGEDELKLLTSTGMTGLCHLTGGHIAWDWTQGFLHARQARLPTEPHPTPRQ